MSFGTEPTVCFSRMHADHACAHAVSSSGAGNNTSNQPLAVSAGDTASTQSQNLPSQILPEDVAALLRSALANACQKLRSDLKGVWADALLPLSHAEWKRLRPVSMRGSLRCQASDLLHFITPPLATRPNSHRPLDPCAIAAVAALATVSRVCALAQVSLSISLCKALWLFIVHVLVTNVLGVRTQVPVRMSMS